MGRSFNNKVYKKMKDISVIIITKNEEKNIRDCLESVKWTNEIIIVDDESTDNTVEIATQYPNVKIYIRKMTDGFGAQKNFALSKATSQWVLNIDADERVPEELKNEILQKIENENFDGYYLRRINYLFGNFWDDSKAQALRLFKKNKGEFLNVQVHEKVILKGKVGILKNPLFHYSKALSSIENYINVYLNDYTTKTAADLYKKGKRITKFNFLYFFILKPFLIFWQKFFLKKYCLRGILGLIMASLVAIAYFLSYIKLWEMQKKYG